MIGIVGAGIGGLALSHYLAEAGVAHVVLEAEERAGGVIRSTREGTRVLDHGPQRTRVSPALRALIRAAGLEQDVVEMAPRLPLFVCRGGRLRKVPFSLPELARTDLLSVGGKVRVLLEPATDRPRLGAPDATGDRGQGNPVDAESPADPGETVGDLFIRKFGEEAYLNLLGPLFGGLFGSDPREMYARHALAPVLRGLGISRSILWRFARGALGAKATPPAVTFRDGMEQLPMALLALRRDSVRLGARVHGVRKADGGWVLESSAGAFEVDGVVFTSHAGVTARLLADVAPDAGRGLASLAYNTLVLVHLHARTPLHGLGYQVAFGEELRTRGVTWNAPAFGRDGVYTAFMGGAKDPELLVLDDAAIGEIARSEFHAVTGYDAECIGVSRTWIPAWDRSWLALDRVRLPAGLHLAANFESRVGIPGRVERARQLAATLARLHPG